MPWKTIQSLLQAVPALKTWPAKYQRQFLAVVNKCLSEGGDEGRCIASAWTAVKRQAETDNNPVSEEH